MKVIILDVTDDLLEKEQISAVTLDEEKEYKFEPLFIRILDNNNHEKLIQTSNFPEDIEHNDNYLKNLELNTITFEEQNNYLVSRIKIDFHKEKIVIIEIATTKEILTSTLEDILYILSFILPIVLIFSILGGSAVISSST